MRDKINSIIDALIVEDYILFISIFILFITLIIFAILIRDKQSKSIILIIFAFLIITLGPTVGYSQMHKFLFKSELELVSEKKLEFTKAIVVHGKVRNISKRDFQSCKITATAYKKSSNELKNYILKLKPIQNSSIVQYDIFQNQIREFKMFIEPFVYTKDYEVTLKVSCK